MPTRDELNLLNHRVILFGLDIILLHHNLYLDIKLNYFKSVQTVLLKKINKLNMNKLNKNYIIIR